MSAVPQPDAEALMVESICADADAQVRQIVDAAIAAAQEEANRIEGMARDVREELLAKAHDKAKKRHVREVALANVEARRLVLTAREQSVNKVCGRIRAALDSIRADAIDYHRSLVTLFREATEAIGNSRIRVTVSEQDRGIVEGVLREMPENGGEAINLAFKSEQDGAGCIAESHDGRIIFDNTYARRIATAMRSLRANIIQEVAKHHE